MGRPASLWLQRCYEILADGQWHASEDVIKEMVKTVPPAVAYRRGVKIAYSADTVSRQQLIRRGARHLVMSSLNGAGYLERTIHGGVELMRLTNTEVKKAPLPRLVDVVEEIVATHVLVPIDHVTPQTLRQQQLEFVRVR